MVWLDLDDVRKIGTRVFLVAAAHVKAPATVVSLAMLRVEPKRFGVVGDGSLNFALRLPDFRARVDRVGLCRVQLDGFVVIIQSGIKVPLLCVEDSALQVGDVDPRLDLDRTAEVGNGATRVSKRVPAEGAVYVESPILRMELDRSAVILDGALMVTLEVPYIPQGDKRLAVLRVDLERLLLVGDGSVQVSHRSPQVATKV